MNNNDLDPLRVQWKKIIIGASLFALCFFSLPSEKAEAGFVLAKYDSNGNLLWTRDDPAGGSDFYYLSLDSADNILILGEYVLVKYTQDGAELWRLAEGGKYLDINENDQILHGLTNSNEPYRAYGVAMRDKNGQLLWRDGLSHKYSLLLILNDTTDNWYVQGWDIISNVDYVFKYNNLGERLWTYFRSDDNYIRDISSHYYGNLYLLLENEPNIVAKNYILLVLDPDGEQQWSIKLAPDFSWDNMTVDDNGYSYLSTAYRLSEGVWEEGIYINVYDQMGEETYTYSFSNIELSTEVASINDTDVDIDGNIVILADTPIGDPCWSVVYKLYPGTDELWSVLYQDITRNSSQDTKSMLMIDNNNEIILFGDGQVGAYCESTGRLALAKCSPDGQELWMHAFIQNNSLSSLDAMGAAVDSENNIYILGRWNSSDDTDDDDSNPDENEEDGEEDGCGC